MILAYETALGGIKMCEVEDEAQAFAEMRRFNEVNHVESDETDVYWVEEKEHAITKIKIPRHKKVDMMHGFGIYHDAPPPYLQLGDESTWEVRRDVTSSDYRYNPALRKSVCWYDELVAYFKDLETRKGGEI